MLAVHLFPHGGDRHSKDFQEKVSLIPSKLSSVLGSAANSIAAIAGTSRHSHFVPTADVSRCSKAIGLFDNFIGASEQHRRDLNAERPRSL